jgi:hypothetical protein
MFLDIEGNRFHRDKNPACDAKPISDVWRMILRKNTQQHQAEHNSVKI